LVAPNPAIYNVLQTFPLVSFYYICRMRLTATLFCFFILYCATSLRAQPAGDVWSLEDCVNYAVEHNISIKQDSINARLARYSLMQSQLSQLPTLSASGSYGRSYGRSINPTTNQFGEGDYDFVSASGNANLLLFGWLQVRNTISKNKYALQASLADLDQLKDDVSLNVANGFLAVLLAEEQVHISESQVKLSQAQLDQTRAFTNAGRLPELNVAQLESQVAGDSANLINAVANYNSSILDLKTLLNLDFSESMQVEVPDVQVSDQVALSNMQPEQVYQTALQHFGSVKGSKYRVGSAEKSLAAAKASLYPQLSLGYQAGTNYATNYQTVSRIDTLYGVPSTQAYIQNSTGNSYIYENVPLPIYTNTPFGTQLRNNFRQSVFFSLNVNLFNSWQSRYAVRQAQMNLATQQLNEYNAELTLKQNVYKAYNNAVNAIQKYNAAKHSAEAAQRALDFARKRYDLGLTSTVDLLVTQNTQFAAASNLVSAKYDLIFKLKVIDYYLGKELKL
jgi:outer membrane protein